jgi:4-amino-4-deoxy-L-arabinose transferase-like glycosyltransferase
MPILPILRQKNRFLDLLLIVVLCLITLVYWQGVAGVPFHPDESTYLYMSADWESFISNPISLTYQANNIGTRQRYRLLDPPLGRYLIGISRSIAGFQAPNTDWDWTLTWEENNLAGALPSPALLTAARFGPAALFPFSLALIYLTGWRLGGRFLGGSSMLFLATNALVLLHTRRAMSESGLLFTICLFMACLVSCRKRPWLIGIPAALMVCAKHSTLPLAIIGLLAVFLYASKPIHWRSLAASSAGFSAVFLTIFLLLNPFLWIDPLHALQAALIDRQDLLLRQTSEFDLAQPDAVLDTSGKAALSMVANLFITPPAVADVGNYLAETAASTQQYLADPVNHLFRNLYLGGVMLALSVLGFLMSVWRASARGSIHRQPWILLTCAALVQFLALVLTVTLPFQRYVIPLIPFTCLWIGYSLYLLKQKASQIRLNPN